MNRKQLIVFYVILLVIDSVTIIVALRTSLPDSILTFAFVVEAELAVAIPLAKMLETKPKVEIETVREDKKLGFKITTRRKSLTKPRVLVNGVEQKILEGGLPKKVSYGELEILYADSPYVVWPYRIECEMGTDPWLHMRLYDINDNEILIGEMKLEKKQAITNATATLQVFIFNSAELDETKRLELAFYPVADYVGSPEEPKSPCDFVNVRMIDTTKKSRWRKLKNTV